MTLWTGNMGDSFHAAFRFAAARPGRRKAEQFFCPSVDDAQIDIAEPKEPVAIDRFCNADGLAGERLADEDEIAAPLDLAGGTDPAHGVLGVIPRLLEALGKRARGRSIAAGRGLLAERLVWPKFVEERNELIEAGLLLATGLGGRSSGVLLQGSMHALMASVLLRRAGVDPLQTDAELQPPHRELAQAGGPCAGEGRSFVHSHSQRRAALTKRLLESRAHARQRRGDDAAGEHIAADRAKGRRSSRPPARRNRG